MEATLEAVKRTGKGKNEARRLRAGGQGAGGGLRRPEGRRQGRAGARGRQPEGDDADPAFASGVNTLITLTVPGESTQRVLVKEFQLDPVTQHLLHADFYRVNLERRITVSVPLVLHGEARGVKQQDGVLEFLHKEVEVECLPTEIPEHIDIDVSNLELGQAIYMQDIAANVTWTPVSERRPDARARRDRQGRGRGGAGGCGRRARPRPLRPRPAEPEVMKKGKTDKEGDDKDKSKK